ncbi:MAG: PaREP1 family protein [Desulfurococcales archaeon]|nr:PaREP1 family protein [Desulfurococcales archaeon]
MSVQLVVRGRVARRILEEAEKLGVTPDEYLVELVSQGLDPKDRALEYVEAAKGLLEEAREELGKGNVSQAAEKAWGASALAVKAYAYWRDEKRLTSHGELWEYKRRIEEELGDWVSDAWAQANTMHICFYEDWCTRGDVEVALRRVKKLVEEVALRVK